MLRAAFARTMSFDVVVVGAGPAGFSAASTFAAHGIATLICDARHIPTHDDCGDAILPNGLLALEELGVLREELRAVGNPLSGVRYISASGARAEACFAEGPGVAIRRTELSKLLVRHLHRLDSLTLMEGVRAEVNCDSDGVRVLVNGRTLTPRLVVAADGLNSEIRSTAGLLSEYRFPERWGTGQLFRTRNFNDQLQVYWGESVQASIAPMGPEEVRVTILSKDRPGIVDPSELARRLFQTFPALRKQLANAEALTEPRVFGPLHQVVPRIARDGLVLIGDAAGYVDALAGEGISLALRQGVLLNDVARAVFRALREQRLVKERELRSFVSKARSAVEYAHELTRWLVQLSRRPKLVGRAVDVFAKDPELFQQFLSASMGLMSPYTLPGRAGVRSLASLAIPELMPHPQLGIRVNA